MVRMGGERREGDAVSTGEQLRAALAEVDCLNADIAELVGLLRKIEPHLDAIVCYASTMKEHEPNRIVHDIRAALAKHGGNA